MEPIRRSAARYRVHLSVRYEVAADFVREYAENLSKGGMFIRGGRGLTRHRDVSVTVELPGLGEFVVRAEVAHVISPEVAAEHARAAGAGLSIVDPPPEFEQALADYLVRLGRRGDSVVLCAAASPGRLLAAAGFQVGELGGPGELGRQLGRAEQPVVGVVVPGAELNDYALAAAEAGCADLVVAMDEARQLDRVLELIDRRL